MSGDKVGLKRSAVRKLVKFHKVDLLLQKRKICKKIESIVHNVWGFRKRGREWVHSEGLQGGLITVWTEEALKLVDVIKS